MIVLAGKRRADESHLLGLVPLWLCSLAPPSGSDWLLHSECSASTGAGFLATHTIVQIQILSNIPINT